MEGQSTLAAQAAPKPEGLIGRRVAPRAQCSVAVEVREAGGWCRASLRDISRSGFRVLLRSAGEGRGSLWLRLPGLPPLPAKVCWREGNMAGCQFLYPLDEKLEATVWEVLGLGSARRRVTS
jgi:hypothetical protein